jgi:hypothetical protein
MSPKRLTPKKLGWTRSQKFVHFLILSEEVLFDLDTGRRVVEQSQHDWVCVVRKRLAARGILHVCLQTEETGLPARVVNGVAVDRSVLREPSIRRTSWFAPLV